MWELDFNVDIDFDLLEKVCEAPEKVTMSDIRTAFPKMWANVWMAYERNSINSFEILMYTLDVESWSVAKNGKGNTAFYRVAAAVMNSVQDNPDACPAKEHTVRTKNGQRLGIPLLLVACKVILDRKPEGWTKKPVDTSDESGIDEVEECGTIPHHGKDWELK